MNSLSISKKQFAYHVLDIANKNASYLVNLESRAGVKWNSTTHYGDNFELKLEDYNHSYKFALLNKDNSEDLIILVSGSNINLTTEEEFYFKKLINSIKDITKPEPKKGRGTFYIC